MLATVHDETSAPELRTYSYYRVDGIRRMYSSRVAEYKSDAHTRHNFLVHDLRTHRQTCARLRAARNTG